MSHEESQGALAHGHKRPARKKHHPYKRLHVDFHDDGTGTMHFEHESDPNQDVHTAVPDLDSVHDQLEAHAGEPNPGEEQGEAEPQGQE